MIRRIGGFIAGPARPYPKPFNLHSYVALMINGRQSRAGRACRMVPLCVNKSEPRKEGPCGPPSISNRTKRQPRLL